MLAPALQERYDLGLEGVGVVLATVNLGVLVTVLPWGVLADRVGERAVIAWGLAAAGLGVAAAAVAPGAVGLGIALFAAGAFGACVQSASGRAVMGWFPPRQRGLALGIRQTAVPLGGAAAALVLPLCLAAGGVRAALGVLSAALLVAAAAGAVWLREPERGPPAAGGAATGPLADSRIWRLCWASGLLYVALASLVGFAVLFLHGDRGLSTQAAAALLALVEVAGAALRLAAGRWSDRVGMRVPLLRRLGVALALATAACAALVDAPLPVLVPVLVVAGSLSQSWNGLSFTAAAELAGYARSGAAIGLQQASLSLSSVVTPVAFAALVGATSWAIGFAMAALAALAGTIALIGMDAAEAGGAVPPASAGSG